MACTKLIAKTHGAQFHHKPQHNCISIHSRYCFFSIADYTPDNKLSFNSRSTAKTSHTALSRRVVMWLMSMNCVLVIFSSDEVILRLRSHWIQNRHYVSSANKTMTITKRINTNLPSMNTGPRTFSRVHSQNTWRIRSKYTHWHVIWIHNQHLYFSPLDTDMLSKQPCRQLLSHKSSYLDKLTTFSLLFTAFLTENLHIRSASRRLYIV